MNWITVDELMVIHAKVIAETGGAGGIVNGGALQSAVQRPFTTFAGNPLFESLVDKVAARIHSIVSFHPFVDGNKRAALVAGDVVLRLNQQRLKPSEEVEPFFWSIARGEKDVAEIAAWLETNTEPFESSPEGEHP